MVSAVLAHTHMLPMPTPKCYLVVTEHLFAMLTMQCMLLKARMGDRRAGCASQ